jgi:DNA-binding CsgD family transcriptional regulator
MRGPCQVPEAEQLSLLIEAIYDSAVDPGRWPAALGAASRFIGGLGGGIYIKDAASRTGELRYQGDGIADRDTARYFDDYVRVDPTTIRHYFLSVGDMASTTDLMPYEEFTQSRVYREWAAPLGLVDHLSAMLDKDQTSISLFGVFRDRRHGMVDDEMRRRMRLVVPHVRRSVMIGGLLERRAVARDALAQTLDALRAAVFLLDATSAIRHANVAGLAMLNGDGPVREVNGRLAGVERELRGPGPDDPAGVFEPVTGRDGKPYLVQVLPLGGPHRLVGDAVSAVFVQPTTLPMPTAPEAIAKAYRLTPTELRTLMAIAEIGGVPQVAEALGISETTVKFHLRGVYAKTGSTRQADLVKLVAGFSGP